MKRERLLFENCSRQGGRNVSHFCNGRHSIQCIANEAVSEQAPIDVTLGVGYHDTHENRWFSSTRYRNDEMEN